MYIIALKCTFFDIKNLAFSKTCQICQVGPPTNSGKFKPPPTAKPLIVDYQNRRWGYFASFFVFLLASARGRLGLPQTRGIYSIESLPIASLIAVDGDQMNILLSNVHHCSQSCANFRRERTWQHSLLRIQV